MQNAVSFLEYNKSCLITYAVTGSTSIDMTKRCTLLQIGFFMTAPTKHNFRQFAAFYP